MPIEITESEILDEINRAANAKGDGSTAPTLGELATAAGVGETTMRRRLRPLLESGTIKPVRVYRRSLFHYDGALRPMTGFIVTP